MDDSLEGRIRRLYAALAATAETDTRKFPAKILKTKDAVIVQQDFRGGLSDDDLTNLAQMVIHNVAHLRDHMARRAVERGIDQVRVKKEVESGPAMQIVIDLANFDKHGGDRRDGGLSRKQPRLKDVERSLQLGATADGPGSATFVLGGQPKTTGSGYAEVVVSGTVEGNDGRVLGDLRQILRDAVKELEAVLAKYQLAGG